MAQACPYMSTPPLAMSAATRHAVLFLGTLAAAPSAVAQQQSLDDLFPQHRVLEVEITLERGDWDEIRHQSRGLADALHAGRQFEPVSSPYTYVQASITIDGVTYPEVGLRKKGFIGSQDSGRPSLKVKLDRFDKELNIGGLDNLTLNNNKQDRSLMSQFMGYRIFNAAGSPAPRCAYARVTVNGENLGIYSHVETIREHLIEREFGHPGGTLFEASVTDFYRGWEMSFEHKSGDDESGRARLEDLIAQLDLDDPDDFDPKAVWKIVDERAFYTFWAVEGLLGFWDGYSGNRNNYFIYLDPRSRKFHFMPWGADCMFEKYSQLGEDPRSPRSVRMQGLLTNRLYQVRAVRARYARTMKSLLARHWNERRLLAEIERIAAMLEPHLTRRQGREFDVAFDAIHKFIRERRDDVEKEIRGGDMPEWSHDPEPPPVIAGIVWVEGEFETAAKDGDLAALQQHLEDGVDVNRTPKERGSALGVAAFAGQIDAMKLLIGHGADVNIRNDDGNTPMHGAAFFGEFDAVELLLDSGADLNLRNDKGETPRDSAATPWSRDLAGIVQFIATIVGVEVDMAEVRTGRLRAAALLHRRGGKFGDEFSDPTEDTVWGTAKAGDLEKLRALLDQGADPDKPDAKTITPLCWAAMAGQEPAARALIEHGADVNARNGDGATALHGAAFFGARSVVDLLLENGADVGALNKEGRTALETIEAGWSREMQGVVTWIATSLQLKVDPRKIKAAWPGIASTLRKHRR